MFGFTLEKSLKIFSKYSTIFPTIWKAYTCSINSNLFPIEPQEGCGALLGFDILHEGCGALLGYNILHGKCCGSYERCGRRASFVLIIQSPINKKKDIHVYLIASYA